MKNITLFFIYKKYIDCFINLKQELCYEKSKCILALTYIFNLFYNNSYHLLSYSQNYNNS